MSTTTRILLIKKVAESGILQSCKVMGDGTSVPLPAVLRISINPKCDKNTRSGPQKDRKNGMNLNFRLKILFFFLTPGLLYSESDLVFIPRGEIVSVQNNKGIIRIRSTPADAESTVKARDRFLNEEKRLIIRDRTGIDAGAFITDDVRLVKSGPASVLQLYGRFEVSPEKIRFLAIGNTAGIYTERSPYKPPVNFEPAPRKSLPQFYHHVDKKLMLLVPGDYVVFGQGSDPSLDNYNPYFFERDPAITPKLESFYMDKYPVTNAEYSVFLKETGRRPPLSWRNNGGMYPQGKGDHPFSEAGYEDALAYARWSGKKLPSELQWEMAARGGLSLLSNGHDPESLRATPPAYPIGDTFDPEKCNTIESGTADTVPVQKTNDAGPYGIMGMCGNVSQWTSDYYRPYPGHRFREKGMSGTLYRIIRGGSWRQDKTAARSDSRDYAGFPSPGKDFTAGIRLIVPAKK